MAPARWTGHARLAMNSPRRPVKHPTPEDGLPSPEAFADARARLERMALDPRYAYLLDPDTIERNRGR